MYRVGLNTAITHYRKDRRKIESQPINEAITEVKSEDYDSKVDEQLDWLYQKINQFSKIDKALVLLYLENKRYDEIAETLGITAINARVKMNRIKKRLKKMIKE